MLLLFNFEKKYFDDENIKNTFVGHPLIEKEEKAKTVLNDLIKKDKKIKNRRFLMMINIIFAKLINK